MMDEQDFQKRADQALGKLSQALIATGDEYEFETDFTAGALTVEFEEPPGRFVVSPNSPVRQIWVSALSKSHKLDWHDDKSAFVFGSTGETLSELMGRLVSEQVGTTVTL